MANQKKKSQYGTSDPLKLPGLILKIAAWVYLSWMFIVFPLFYQNGYSNIGTAKFAYFRTYTIVYLVVSILAGGFFLIIHLYDIHWESLLRRTSWIDRFVLLYLAGLLLSYLFSDYKGAALWGYSGWNMGLVAQILFIFAYFFLSRFFSWHKAFYWIMLAPSTLVFLLAVLHRFSIDPLGLHQGLSAYNRLMFISTIGQATWYSSYLCVLLPIGMVLYWHHTTTSWRKMLGAYCTLGFASFATQNSDSAYIAIGLVFLTLFCCSFRSNEQFKRFLELVLLCLGSMRVVGIFQLLFPQRVPNLDSLSLFLTKSPLLWMVLIAVLAAYLLFLKAGKSPSMDISRFKVLRNLALASIALLAVLVLAIVYLTTTGRLPDGLKSLESVNYLNFNNKWGNGRGFTWKYAASMFREYSWKNRLFGCGPDAFAAYSYPLHQEYLQTQWSNPLSNAHNEWLNIILTLGLAGGIAYIGVFVSGIVYFLRRRQESPLFLVVACCLISYMGHNLFCYQQAVCTSLIFILLGVGSSLTRQIDTGAV